MGLWSTIGHAVLRYGPYAAAPFTGGASLALAPYTNAADAAWSVGDAIANDPSRQQSTGPYTGANMGPPRGPGSAQSPTSVARPGIGPSNMPSQSSSTQSPNGYPLFGSMQQNSGNIFGKPRQVDENTNTQLFNPTYGMMPQDSTNPNLSFALNQGKTNALMNQPWRASSGIYPNIPLNQRQYQPQPTPLAPIPSYRTQSNGTLLPPQGSFVQNGQLLPSLNANQQNFAYGNNPDWQTYLQQHPELMQQMTRT